MYGNRRGCEKYIYWLIDNVAKGGENLEMYKELFKHMTDKEFHRYMIDLRDRNNVLSIIRPNDGSVVVTVENNYKVAKEIGYEFYQRLEITDPVTGDKWLTPNKYLIMTLPIKRMSQLLTKGISVSPDATHVDLLTGQVAGASMSAKITMPEEHMLVGMGLIQPLVELLKFRGGDLGGKNALMNILYKRGKVDLATLEEYSTGVVGTKTLKNYFLSAHIKPTGLG